MTSGITQDPDRKKHENGFRAKISCETQIPYTINWLHQLTRKFRLTWSSRTSARHSIVSHISALPSEEDIPPWNQMHYQSVDSIFPYLLDTACSQLGPFLWKSTFVSRVPQGSVIGWLLFLCSSDNNSSVRLCRWCVLYKQIRSAAAPARPRETRHPG